MALLLCIKHVSNNLNRVDLNEQLIYIFTWDLTKKIYGFNIMPKPNFHGYNNVGQMCPKMNRVIIKTILSYPLSHSYDYISILHDYILILVMVTIT
jgi:hypothetical protein